MQPLEVVTHRRSCNVEHVDVAAHAARRPSIVSSEREERERGAEVDCPCEKASMRVAYRNFVSTRAMLCTYD